MANKMRLDAAMAARGLAPSREKAHAMILAGIVFVKGKRADKASLMVGDEEPIEVRGAPHPYVSRGGLKLEKAMRVFGVDAQGVVAVDIGASTGGFTDVLLRAGAAKVYAVDVGYGQLDWKLRQDSRVIVMERTNARTLLPEMFPDRPTLCVMDVAFISIRLILPTIAAVMGGAGRMVTLVKPQFEAGRDQVGKKGVVRDPKTHLEVLSALRTFVVGMGWQVRAADFSPVTGPEGNIEFLFDLMPEKSADRLLIAADMATIVEDAHKKLAMGLR